MLGLGSRNHIVDRKVLGNYEGESLIGNDNLFWFLSSHRFEDFKLWFSLCSSISSWNCKTFVSVDITIIATQMLFETSLILLPIISICVIVSYAINFR